MSVYLYSSFATHKQLYRCRRVAPSVQCEKEQGDPPTTDKGIALRNNVIIYCAAKFYIRAERTIHWPERTESMVAGMRERPTRGAWTSVVATWGPGQVRSVTKVGHVRRTDTKCMHDSPVLGLVSLVCVFWHKRGDEKDASL